jgi:hypothetical protein
LRRGTVEPLPLDRVEPPINARRFLRSVIQRRPASQ